MNICDIINKKKRGLALNKGELEFFASGYMSGGIPDYQASALLMAICLCGMNGEETSMLTTLIRDSGEQIDLSRFGDATVDKHSTGGVGDKTTMIIAPIAAAVGCKIAKLSGRALGHTGGTIDKLESIPGMSTSLSTEQFCNQVENIGIAVAGGNRNLAPLDKRLYALRDVTATVDSIPLIASSIMGKKLAAGSRSIVLDVKYGSGSFVKTAEGAERLAEAMLDIGQRCGRRVSAVITDMDSPLGHAVGNILEVKEAISALSGNMAEDLAEVCYALAAEMVHLGLGVAPDEARRLCLRAVSSGEALKKLKKWIGAQGGDTDCVENPDKFGTAAFSLDVRAREDGYITAMDTERIGMCALRLGAGRITKDSVICPEAGLLIKKKVGDPVRRGEAVATLFANEERLLPEVAEDYISALCFGESAPRKTNKIHKIIRSTERLST